MQSGGWNSDVAGGCHQGGHDTHCRGIAPTMESATQQEAPSEMGGAVSEQSGRHWGYDEESGGSLPRATPSRGKISVLARFPVAVGWLHSDAEAHHFNMVQRSFRRPFHPPIPSFARLDGQTARNVRKRAQRCSRAAARLWASCSAVAEYAKTFQALGGVPVERPVNDALSKFALCPLCSDWHYSDIRACAGPVSMNRSAFPEARLHAFGEQLTDQDPCALPSRICRFSVSWVTALALARIASA